LSFDGTQTLTPLKTGTICFTGITTFDLMGEFGRFNWLGNLQLILLYNLWFEVASAVCLMKKLTAAVREALFERFKKPWKKLKSLV
jgi:hypothetical protein